VLDASIACVAGGNEARIALDVDEGLGPVWADHDRLEQVFVNLLDNALRHTPPETKVRVTAGVDATGREVHIRVSDDGAGLAPARAAALFEPHVSVGAHGGTGLGLPIARGIAVAHGGELTLDATDGSTTFLVALPLKPETDSDG
jgi:signal transduction histidine kinase